ncbi:hypothetical protein ACIOK4_07170 [Streptomyces bottropensis]|uniref:hypothetical protein n=1 Tax=Streptomyces bottropensis TaxID=42235 RepID=UPI003803ED3D
MAGHGTIAGVSHLEGRGSRADRNLRRGIVEVAASRGSKPDHTGSTSDATAGTSAATTADSRSRQTRHA